MSIGGRAEVALSTRHDLEKGSMEVNRHVIGSIYSEKLSFDGEHLRTTRINEAVRKIYTIREDFQETKEDKTEIFLLCPFSSREDKIAFVTL